MGLGIGVESAGYGGPLSGALRVSPFLLFPLLLLFGLPKINSVPVELSLSQVIWRVAASVPLYCITFYVIGLVLNPFLKSARQIASHFLDLRLQRMTQSSEQHV